MPLPKPYIPHSRHSPRSTRFTRTSYVIYICLSFFPFNCSHAAHTKRAGRKLNAKERTKITVVCTANWNACMQYGRSLKIPVAHQTLPRNRPSENPSPLAASNYFNNRSPTLIKLLEPIAHGSANRL